MLNDGVPSGRAAPVKGAPMPSPAHPASTSGEAAQVAGEAAAQPSGAPVTVATATALAVANMVGIGVFTSLGFQVRDLPSGFTLLALWAVGGLVALCGALSYAELATAFPRSGGEYNLLSRIYHRAVGFMAGWLSATVGFSAPTALAAMAFSGYLANAWPGAPQLAAALAVVWIVALVHLLGTEGASAFQNVSTLFKVVLIVGLIGAALVYGQPQPISFAPAPGDLALIASPAFAISLAYRHVCLQRLERGHLHRRRGEGPATHCAAVGDRRGRAGHAALRRPQRRVPLHHADGEHGGADPRWLPSPASTFSARPGRASSMR